MGFEDTSGRNVQSHYGPRDNKSYYGGEQGSKGRVKTAVWTLGVDELNGDLPQGATHNLGMSIPAGSVLQSAMLNIKTAADGTTPTLTVGLEQADGTAIDVDGIDVAVSIASVGSVACDGALIGASIGEAAGELTVACSAADNTTGEVEIVVEYMY